MGPGARVRRGAARNDRYCISATPRTRAIAPSRVGTTRRRCAQRGTGGVSAHGADASHGTTARQTTDDKQPKYARRGMPPYRPRSSTPTSPNLRAPHAVLRAPPRHASASRTSAPPERPGGRSPHTQDTSRVLRATRAPPLHLCHAPEAAPQGRDADTCNAWDPVGLWTDCSPPAGPPHLASPARHRRRRMRDAPQRRRGAVRGRAARRTGCAGRVRQGAPTLTGSSDASQATRRDRPRRRGGAVHCMARCACLRAAGVSLTAWVRPDAALRRSEQATLSM